MEKVLKRNEKVFEINLNTKDICLAKYNSIGIMKKIIERKDCIYIPALNKGHAKVKFDNILGTFKTTSLEDLKDELKA